jgi:elongation factor Ts
VAIDQAKIRELRELTSAGVMDCKRALEENDWNLDKARKAIEAQGLLRAEKRADREASQGVIESYIHQSRIGAMVELNCETDFVGRTDDFRALARNIAQQVASMDPKYLTAAEIPDSEGAPASQLALLEQPYIRDGSKTIGQMVTELSAKTGEKVAVRRFARFELGRA